MNMQAVLTLYRDVSLPELADMGRYKTECSLGPTRECAGSDLQSGFAMSCEGLETTIVADPVVFLTSRSVVCVPPSRRCRRENGGRRFPMSDSHSWTNVLQAREWPNGIQPVRLTKL